MATGVARRGVGVLLLTAMLTVVPVVAGPGSSADAQAAARKTDQTRAAARRLQKRHALERRRLTRALRASPRAALKASFLKRAAIAGLRMPVTVRLRSACDPAQNPPGSAAPGGDLPTDANCATQGTALNQLDDTELGVTWSPLRFPLDAGLFPAPAAEQTLHLAGTFPMVIDFGAGPGYGGIGNLQARSGPGGRITAAGPLVMSELAGCTGTPPAFVEAATGGGAPIVASAATQTWVDLNPFTGDSDGYLDLKLSVRSRVLSGGAACGPPDPVSADYDVPVSASSADPWNTPVRIRWSGSFRIAPSIASDGAIRLGKISVDGATQPQQATTGNLWGCAAESVLTGAGLPVGTPCTSASPLVPSEPVSPAPFPASLVVKKLSADILLGDRN